MVNPISYQQQQAFSGGADFSPLANLGNIYKKAQEDARQQSVLAQLGGGLDADARTLLTSGVPGLAQLGLNLQQSALNRQREDARYAVTDARAAEAEKRAGAHLTIAQEAARRQQEEYDKKAADEADAARLLSGLTGGARPQGTTPQGAFPAPLPGATPQPAVPQQPPQDTTAPPVVAAGGDAGLPAWADPVTARIATNLTSGQPAAAAGISRDQIAELYRNPLTRPIATAFLQKQADPGTWSYHFDNDTGRVIATNTRDPSMTKDVTPGGGKEGTKQEREVQGYFAAGKKLGMTDEQATAYAANKGKMPSEDLHPDERKAITTLTNEAQAGQRVISNIQELKNISKKAWGYPGAQKVAETTGYLPEMLQPEGAIQTQDLTNAARLNVTNIAKAVFGARITNVDLELLKELEGSANQPDAVRQKIFKRAEDMINLKIQEAKDEAEGIRKKTFFKPGGGEKVGGGGAGGGGSSTIQWSIVK